MGQLEYCSLPAYVRVVLVVASSNWTATATVTACTIETAGACAAAHVMDLSSRTTAADCQHMSVIVRQRTSVYSHEHRTRVLTAITARTKHVMLCGPDASAGTAAPPMRQLAAVKLCASAAAVSCSVPPASGSVAGKMLEMVRSVWQSRRHG